MPVDAVTVGPPDDAVQPQLGGQPLLPACLCPPPYDVLANVLEPLVLLDKFHDPAREDVHVRVAVGGQHPDAGVLPEEPMANGEPFLFLHQVLARVCRH